MRAGDAAPPARAAAPRHDGDLAPGVEGTAVAGDGGRVRERAEVDRVLAEVVPDELAAAEEEERLPAAGGAGDDEAEGLRVARVAGLGFGIFQL